MSKNQLHSLKNAAETYYKTVTRVKNRIKYLEAQVKSVDSDVRTVIKKDESLHSKVHKIATIPGVGFNTVASIIGQTNGFHLITNIKQLTSYAGLDIRIQESGKWKGKSKISKKGNSHLRKVLYIPSMSVVRHSEQHKIFHQRLIEKKEKQK